MTDTTDTNAITSLLEDHQRLERAGRLHWFHWLIVGSSLILTFIAWSFVQAQVDAKTQNQFNTEADRIIELTSERMKTYEDALWGGVAAIHAQSHGIDYPEWKRFAEILQIEKKYPGINGIGVIFHILPENKDAYLAQQRQDRPDFKIHPAHEQNDLFPITYIEPLETNKAAIGLDMAHETNRYEAAKQARDTGQPQITGPIILVQDKQKNPGFLFYVPFYKQDSPHTLAAHRKNFTGLVYAPFIFKNLMQGTLAQEKRHVSIKISDAGTTLYDESDSNAQHLNKKDPLFKTTSIISMYGRDWVFEIWSNPAFRDMAAARKPWIILFSGLIIDALLFSLFWFLARTNRRAIQLADNMTMQYQSEAQKLKEIKSFQDLILNTIPDLVFVKDEEFKIVQANDTFLKVYPKSKRDKVIGFTTVEEYAPEEANRFLANDRTALKKGYHETQERIQFPDGKVRTLFTQKLRFTNNDKNYILGVSRDITAMKEAEKEIMRSNAELERFAYIASHDLQEPLRTVTNFTGLLKEDYGDKMPEEATEYMDLTIDAATRMQNLITDLLEYSRMNSEEIGFETFNSVSKIETSIENLKTPIEETKTKITIGDMPEIHTSPIRFTRLMQNLIGNAIKYRSKDKAPEIHINCEDKGKEWQFSVRDNGIGIKAKHLDNIFILFKRLHNKSEYSGTGIGLAICKKIVENMEGTLWVESEFGEGSTFYFTIPKKQQPKK